jgi:hypothetical protein
MKTKNNIDNIFYAHNDEENEIIVDVYEMEQEAIRKLEEKYPNKKVISHYTS